MYTGTAAAHTVGHWSFPYDWHRAVLQAVVACRCQRVAPTVTTIFEIIALAAPLVKTSADAHPTATDSSPEAGHSNHQHHKLPHVPGAAAAQHAVGVPAAPIRFLLLLSLRLARGWAPAVVVAQGVRLVGSVVQQREKKDEKVGREGTEGGQFMIINISLTYNHELVLMQHS